MKTRVELTISLLIFLIILATTLGVVISLSGLLVASIQASEQDYIGAIVGSLGNIIGGIIGVLAAVLVAAYQIRKTFELERNKGAASNSAVLRLLKTELQSNCKLIQNFKSDYMEGNKAFLKSVSIDNWERCSLQIGMETSDTTLNAISSAYRKISLLKSESKINESTYDKLIDDLSTALSNIEEDLELLKTR